MIWIVKHFHTNPNPSSNLKLGTTTGAGQGKVNFKSWENKMPKRKSHRDVKELHPELSASGALEMM